jgi:hypothetical protein
LIYEVAKSKSVLLKQPPLDEGRGRGQKPGKYKRVMEILGPSQESFGGFGVMSAENPMGQQSSAFDNERRMKALHALLKKSGKKAEQIYGKFFNNDENSLVIEDTNIREMADLASNEAWPQHSFIFGKKDKVGNDIHVHYYFVELRYDDSYDMAGYDITDYRTSMFKNAEIQQRSDMFSQAGGRKFYIPFFDESEEIGGEEHIPPEGQPPNPTNQ